MDLITDIKFKPPPYIIFFAWKYLKGVRYFKKSSLSFKSIAIETMKVTRSIPVETEVEVLGSLHIAAREVPKNRNNSAI